LEIDPNVENGAVQDATEQEEEQEEDSPPAPPKGEYYIDGISRRRKNRSGRFEYFVKWTRFTNGTWEPYQNVKDTLALQQFNRLNGYYTSLGSREESKFGIASNKFESVSISFIFSQNLYLTQ